MAWTGYPQEHNKDVEKRGCGCELVLVACPTRRVYTKRCAEHQLLAEVGKS